MSCSRSYLRSNATSYNMPAQFPTVHPFVRSISGPWVSSIVDQSLLSIPQSRVDNNNFVAFSDHSSANRDSSFDLPCATCAKIHVDTLESNFFDARIKRSGDGGRGSRMSNGNQLHRVVGSTNQQLSQLDNLFSR